MPTKTDELRELIAKLKDGNLVKRVAENSLYNATASLTSYAKKNHKFKTRTAVLENATIFDVKGLTSTIFINEKRAPYGPFIYEGTRDHEIVPKDAQALSWVQGNARFFSKGHKVKGIKAEPYILNAYNKRKRQFIKQFRNDMTEELQDAL